MSTVIYLSNQQIQVVQGTKSAGKMQVQAVYSAEAPEGSIINGIIMDPESFVEFLKDFWHHRRLPAKDVDLVVNSTKFVGKTIEMPSMPEAKVTEFLAREFTDIERNEERIYASILLNMVEKKMYKRYVESVGQAFIKDYIDIFGEAGIKLGGIYSGESSIISLAKKTLGKDKKTFLLQIADSMTLTTILWVDGNFYYYNSVRCFHDQGTEEYAGDLARSVSQISQFMKANQVESVLEGVYIAGVEADDIPLYRSIISAQTGVNVTELFDASGTISSGRDIEVQKYLYAISGLCDMGKLANFLKPYYAIEKQKGKKGESAALIVIGGVFVIMLALLLMFVSIRIGKQRALQKLIDYNQSPEVMMESSRHDALSARNNFLSSQYAAIEDISQNILTYPSCSKEIAALITRCAIPYAEVEIDSFSADAGEINMTATASNVDEINKFITNLMGEEVFKDINYTGYTYNPSTDLWNIHVTCTMAESAGR